MSVALWYHVHIYFAEETSALAHHLRASLDGDPMVESLGRMHTGPVGPHPTRQIQVRVCQGNLATLLEWLERRRQGLSVLVHPEIDDDLVAHTELASWLGAPVPLDLELFRVDA